MDSRKQIVKYFRIGLLSVGLVTVILPFLFEAIVLPQAFPNPVWLSAADNVMKLQSAHRGLLFLLSLIILGANAVKGGVPRGRFEYRLAMAVGVVIVLLSCLLFLGR